MRNTIRLHFYCVVFIIIFFAGILPIQQIRAGEGIQHPRLILTPQKIEYLKSASQSTHQKLWKATIALADQFAAESIPKMQVAHNKWRYIGDTMPVLGLAYLMTGNQKYVEASEMWIRALLSVPEWKGSSNLGRSSWVTGCALLYDWLYDNLDEQTLAEMRRRLQKEGHILMEDAAVWRSLSNHFLIETTALGMSGLALEEESNDASLFLKTANQWALQIITDAPLDGSWGEGVQYWQYGLGYFLRFLEAAYTSDFRNYYPEYNWLKLTGYFPIYFSLPGHPTQVINFSDCGSKRYIPAFLLYLPASHYDRGFFQQYGNMVETYKSHKFSWMDFIAYNPERQANDLGQLPTLKHFSDNDFVTMRSDWDSNATIIGFRSGPAPGHKNQQNPERVEKRGFGPGHGHPDINSFNIFAYGEWLAIDPGYTHRKDTRNHNTIIVNGYGQAGAGGSWLDYMAFEAREPAPAILRVESNQIYDYLIGDAGNIYVDKAGLQHFRRHLLFLKPHIIVAYDDLTAQSDSKFEWLLNAVEEIQSLDEGNFQIVRNGVRLWVHPLLPASRNITITSRKVDASDVKDESDIRGGTMTTLTLETDGNQSAHYLVVMCALKDASGTPPQAILQNGHLIITHQDKKWDIRIADPASLAKTSDPVLIVESPPVNSDPTYEFVRKEQ